MFFLPFKTMPMFTFFAYFVVKKNLVLVQQLKFCFAQSGFYISLWLYEFVLFFSSAACALMHTCNEFVMRSNNQQIENNITDFSD